MSTTFEAIRLGHELNGMVMTPAEFDAVEDYDEDYTYELVHGVLVVNPIPLEAEVGPNEFLGYLLLSYQYGHPQGSALNLTLPERYICTRDSRRRADRVIWAGLGRLPNWKREVPTIAAEFVSSGKRNRLRDYVEKRRDYMRLGIKEYWIIDRFRRMMTVIRNRPSRPRQFIIRENETYTTPLLPGFELPLARLLALADMLRQPE
jgi:Uma2 family endonuclease